MALIAKGIHFMIFSFVIIVNAYSQLDTVHWLPPMHSRTNTQVEDHYLYLSTPVTSPFTVTIKDGSGNVLATPVISNATPFRYDIGTGSNTHIMVRKDSLNIPLSTRGLHLSATEEFYANFRVRVGSHAASHTTKGTVAKGTLFRYGAIPTPLDATPSSRNFFCSFFATEDSTLITITDYDTSVVFADIISNITADTLSFWLNAGQTYVISGYHDIIPNYDGFIGALITSTKPIICNVGNWLGGLAPVNHDIAAEQIMPVDKIGNDYVVVAGRGPAILERPIVVAHYDNTQIFTNNNLLPDTIINAGGYYVIPNDRYIAGVHSNMFIRTSQPAYVYQVLGGSSSVATMGFMFIPPANCNLPNYVNQIPSIELIGSLVFQGDIFVVTVAGATVQLNGTTLSGAQAVSGFNWQTYKVMNQTGHAHVVSNMPATIGFMGASGAAGYGSYYSGFHIYTSTPPPSVIEVCTGNNLQLQVIGGASYLWSGPDGFSSTQQNPMVFNMTAAKAGLYYVTVTYPNGCEDVFISDVTVLPLPLAVATSNSPVCHYDTLKLFSSSAVYYSWSGPDNFVSMQQNPVINTASLSSGGTYTVTITDNKGCQNTANVAVVVNSLPVVSMNSNSPQCVNANITVEANGGIQYQWSGPQGFSTIQPNYTINSVTSAVQGYYRVTVTDNNGCKNKDSIFVVINNNPQSTHTLQHISCYGLSDGSITTHPFNGTFPYNFNWDTNPTQTTQTATGLSANTTYTLTITDNNGCSATDSYILTQPQVLQLSISTADALCNGDCNGIATAIVSGGTTPYGYTWLPSGTGGNVPTLSTLCAGSYNVQVSDVNNCIKDTSFVIEEPDLLSTTYLVNNVLCHGGNDGQISLNTSGGTRPYSYLWNPQVSNDSTATNLYAGIYNVGITDLNQCQTTINITVSEPAVLQLSISGNDTVCIGESFTMSAQAQGGVPPYTYLWDNNLGTGQSFILNGTTTSTYQVFVADSNNCVTDTLTMEIFVYPQVSVTAFYSGDSVICLNQSTSLSAQASGGNGGPYSYTWSQNIGNQNPPVNVTPLQSTYYVVTATDNCGSPAGIDSLFVTVHPLPEVAFLSDINEGCEPLTINFSDMSVSDIISWQWDFGDPLSGNDNYSFIQNPTHTYQNDGLYNVTLTVTTVNGCTGLLNIPSMIWVHPLPVAAFNYSPQILSIENPTVFLNDESTGITNLLWYFDDPESGSFNQSTNSNTYHTYTQEGEYIVKLFVSSEFGCLDTAQAIIIFKPEYTFYIPNAFTPNSNGLNDYFGPLGLGIDLDAYHFYIYDRWGKLIFYTNDVNEMWNGSILPTERKAPAGMYNWVITYIRTNDVDKHIYRRSGHVTLLR